MMKIRTKITIYFSLLIVLILNNFCTKFIDKEKVKDSVIQTEKDFEKMSLEKGLLEAFVFFADDSAVINRNDTLYKGKIAIERYFRSKEHIKAEAHWIPNFVHISDDGTLGYTYGTYTWKIFSNHNTQTVYNGIYNTIWKRQLDGNWKYIWD